MSKKILAAAAALLLPAAAMAGCAATDGADATGVPAAAAATHPDIAQLLPEDIRERGYMNNMMHVPNAPLEFLDEDGTLVGIDPALTQAIGEILGIEIRTEEASDFAAMLPSLDSGRADLIFSAMYSTEERVASGYSFLNYFQSVPGIMIREGDADDIVEFSDLCGGIVTANKGTQYPDMAEQISQEHCVDNGLEPIEVLAIEQIPQQIAQLQQGRSTGALMGVEYEAYEMSKAPGEFAIMEPKLEAANYGVATTAANEAILEALKAAFEVLKEDGTYDEILGEWGLEGSGLDEFTIESAK